MLCRSILRSKGILQARKAPAFSLLCSQLRKLPTNPIANPFRGFAQGGGSKGFGGGKPGGPPAKKLTHASVRCEYLGSIHVVEVPTATFFEDAPDFLAQEIGEDVDTLSFRMKTKDGEWMELDDVPEEEKNRGKIEMQAFKQSESDAEQSDFSEDEGERNEAAILAVEDLASAAVSEGKVQKGKALDAAQARAWVTEQAALNEDVRTFVLNTVGGFDHLVQCLQFPFTFSSCFDDAEHDPDVQNKN
jgi:hypothetical protein